MRGVRGSGITCGCFSGIFVLGIFLFHIYFLLLFAFRFYFAHFFLFLFLVAFAHIVIL